MKLFYKFIFYKIISIVQRFYKQFVTFVAYVVAQFLGGFAAYQLYKNTKSKKRLA